MGRIRVITALAVLIILLMNNASANLFYAQSSGSKECSIHGDMKLSLRTTVRMSLEEVIVKAKHSSEPSYYEIKGNWFDKEDNIIQGVDSDSQAIFRSLGSYFSKEGAYSVRIYYKDAYEEINIDCPKFTFSCNDINIEINECYSEGDNFIIEFLGKGLETQKTVLDLEKDLDYRIESQKQIWEFGSVPKNVSFERLGDEVYKMIFPRNKEYPIDSNQLKRVDMRVKQNLETINYLNSGCSGGLYNKIYPNTRDEETKCPTKTILSKNEIEIKKENITKESNEEIAVDENEIGITGKAISKEIETGTPLEGAVLIAGIIGFFIGIIITFLLMKKSR